MQERPSNRNVRTWLLIAYVIASSIAIATLWVMRPEQVLEASIGAIAGLSLLSIFFWMHSDHVEGRRNEDRIDQLDRTARGYLGTIRKAKERLNQSFGNPPVSRSMDKNLLSYVNDASEKLRKLKEERYELAQEKESLEHKWKIYGDDLEKIKKDYGEVVDHLKKAYKENKWLLKERRLSLAEEVDRLNREMKSKENESERIDEIRRAWAHYASQKRAADYWRAKFKNPKTKYHAKDQG